MFKSLHVVLTLLLLYLWYVYFLNKLYFILGEGKLTSGSFQVSDLVKKNKES